ncbi:MAG TPA: hydrogenase maturation protease [Actinomycetota bacterium]|jgi:hydrogenase maturation protease
MTDRVLVAGVGNVFLGDDGFGGEVARRLLADGGVPDGVKVEDYGIRGVHLAYEMLEPYDLVVLVDAVSRGEPPGTVTLIEPDLGEFEEAAPHVAAGESPLVDAHSMTPGSVFALVRAMGGRPSRVLVVGCEPAEVVERMGLSPVVEEAVGEAARTVLDLVREDVGVTASRAAGRPGKEE